MINFHRTAPGLMAMADNLFIVVPGFLLKDSTGPEINCLLAFMPVTPCIFLILKTTRMV